MGEKGNRDYPVIVHAGSPQSSGCWSRKVTAGEALLDSMLGVSESFQPMEVVFPLHHLLNQEFPVRKKGEVWIHNTRHFQLLFFPAISGQREPPPVS